MQLTALTQKQNPNQEEDDLKRTNMFRGHRSGSTIVSDRWSVGTAIVGTRYSWMYRLKRRVRLWMQKVW